MSISTHCFVYIMKIIFKKISCALLFAFVFSIFASSQVFAEGEATVEVTTDVPVDVVTEPVAVAEVDTAPTVDPLVDQTALDTPVQVTTPTVSISTPAPEPVFVSSPGPSPVETKPLVYPNLPRVIGKGPTGIPVPLASSTMSGRRAPNPEQAVLGQKIILLDALIKETGKGNKSSKVVDLQNELKGLGFFPKNIPSSGWYGPVTDAAVKRYLASRSNSMGQVLGVKIVNVDALIAKVHVGEKSDSVKQLQSGLKEGGFFPKATPVTGWYGPVTQMAVKKYLASR